MLSQKNRSLAECSGDVQVLEVVQVDAEQMLENVQRTAAVAEQISARVKELDSAQSNVKKVVTYIQTIMDRQACSEDATCDGYVQCPCYLKKPVGSLISGGG